ncbi:hypothetical protein Tco_0282900 [Tanacetum coccineum]
MDIRDETSLYKDDMLPKASSLRVSDQNKHRNKLPGVKGIGRVSPMKSKSKVTGKNSPKIIKESDKAPVVKEKPVDVIKKSTVVKESDKAPVVAAVVIEKLAVDEKDNPKVTNKVFKYKRKTELPKDNQKDNPKDKESDKVPVVAAVVSEKSAVDEKDNQKVTSKVSKVSDESDKAMVVEPVLKEKPADVIEKSTIIKESDKAPVVKESDKVPIVKESDKAPVVTPILKEKTAYVIEKSTIVNEKEKPVVDVTSKVAKDKEKLVVDVTSKVDKSKAIVHKDKALDVVSKDKPKGNPPSIVGKGKRISRLLLVSGRFDCAPPKLPKKKHKADIPKDKPKPKDKHKVDSEVPVLRSKPEVMQWASVSEDVDSDEVVSKAKKIKIKAEVKKKRKGEKKAALAEEQTQREYLREFPNSSCSWEDALSKFSSTTYRLTFEIGDYIEVTPSKIHDILGILHEELNDDNDDSNGNNDEELNDEDTSGSNPSFGFSKIGLDDFDKQPSLEGTNAEKESVDPTQEGTVVEGNLTQCEIMSTPENYTQWLERNADLVGEIIDAVTDEYLYGELFGDNSMRMEVSNQGPPTSDRMLLALRMQVPVWESELVTRSPGLWIDANVIDCWGAILNREEKLQDAESKSRHLFPTGCISKSMFDGTLPSDDDKQGSFSNQVKAQFKGNEGGLAL